MRRTAPECGVPAGGGVRQLSFNTGFPLFRTKGGLVLVPLTQVRLVRVGAECAEPSQSDAGRAFDALQEVVPGELGDAETTVRIWGLVGLSVRINDAQKARRGRTAASGEEITLARKAATVALRSRPRAKAKWALPSVEKFRGRLAA
jgi:hypothetical protein